MNSSSKAIKKKMHNNSEIASFRSAETKFKQLQLKLREAELVYVRMN